MDTLSDGPRHRKINAGGKLSSSISKTLASIYYSTEHPAGFSNANKLWLATKKKIPKKIITEWLIDQDTYTLHKGVRKNFRRRHYILSNIGELWEADLIVYPEHYSQYNDDVKYVLGELYSRKTKLFSL